MGRHGKVKEDWFVVSASIPEVVVSKIDKIRRKMKHQSRSDTIRMIFDEYFDMDGDNAQK